MAENYEKIIKRNKVALFLDVDETGSKPTFKRVCRSTELTIETNPETEDYFWICDEIPSTELLYFKPSIEQTITMYKGDAVFDYVYKKFKNLDPSNVSGTAIVGFLWDATEESKFAAWKVPITLIPTTLNAVESSITCDIQFGGQIEQGTITTDDEGDGDCKFEATKTISLFPSTPVMKVNKDE